MSFGRFDFAFRDLFAPASGGQCVHIVARRVDRNGNRHVLHFELVDRFHPQIYEFEVQDMPVTVAVDAAGNNVHTLAPAEWRRRIAEGDLEPAE